MPATIKPILYSGAPWRLFTASTLFDGEPLALGRNHASWFLVFPQPHGTDMTRAVRCLNFVLLNDPTTVSASPAATSPANPAAPKPHFTIGGSRGRDSLDMLQMLRDLAGRSPVNIIKNHDGKSPLQLQAVVEVNVPEEELIRACARCGKWETVGAPRFRRCARCKGRYYCSQDCQKEDWQPGYHKGECALLKEGKAYEAECRRKLHDNAWWFNHGPFGPESLLGTREQEFDRALMEGNMELIQYGERIAPRDVPTSDRQLPYSEDAVITQSNYWDEELYVAKTNIGAVQFTRTGDKRLDQALAEAQQFVYAANMAGKLRTVKVEEGGDDIGRSSGEIEDKTKVKRQVPTLPPLPDTPGFKPTGDPLVDEGLLWEIVKHRTNTDELLQLAQLFEARCAVISARREMALDRCCDVAQRRADLQKEIDAEEVDEAESVANTYPASDSVPDPSEDAGNEAGEKTDVSSNKDSSEL